MSDGRGVAVGVGGSDGRSGVRVEVSVGREVGSGVAVGGPGDGAMGGARVNVSIGVAVLVGDPIGGSTLTLGVMVAVD